MNVKMYSVEDEDVLEHHFGRDVLCPLANLGTDFGELVFEGEQNYVQQTGDTVILDEELSVVHVMWKPLENAVILILQPKIYVEVELS